MLSGLSNLLYRCCVCLFSRYYCFLALKTLCVVPEPAEVKCDW